MYWLSIAAAYVIGSIPCGVLVARLYKVDLRSKGSGNIGATNALRVIGKKAGVVTLFGDMFKGALAVYIAVMLAGREAGVLAAGAAVVGHDFSLFMGFKGGKGVATTLGVMAALDPAIAAGAVIIWVLVVALWRYSSLGALVSLATLPLMALLLRQGDKWLWSLSIFLTALAFMKHRSNIVRLVRGIEPKVGTGTA